MEPINTLPDWNGVPYFPISFFYKRFFGERVHKISVGIASTCPNRRKHDGTGCVFCDQWGSAANPLTVNLPLSDQIHQQREYLIKRFKVNKFLVYFQAFTSTFIRLPTFDRQMETALGEKGIVGIAIGTRPDALPNEIFARLKSFHETHFVSIELGVQSFFNKHLLFLNRGHTVEQSVDAIEQLHQKSGVNIAIHLIFGLPEESDREIIETARIINNLPVDAVKLHNLHVLANTPLETLYATNQFEPIDLNSYTQKVILFLENLSPAIAVHRLAASVSRSDQLIAPEWMRERSKPSQYIIQELRNKKTYQGKLFP